MIKIDILIKNTRLIFSFTIKGKMIISNLKLLNKVKNEKSKMYSLLVKENFL